MKTYMMKFIGRRVREFRKRRKLTQAELAEKINKTVEMVCHLENNTASTKITTLIDIAEALDVQPFQFLTDKYDFDMEDISPEMTELIMELRDLSPETIKSILSLVKSISHK